MKFPFDSRMSLALLAAMAFLGDGCIVVNGSKPETHAKTRTVFETATSPSTSYVTAVQPSLEKRNGVLALSIRATIHEEFPKTRHEETVTVQKKKKLAIGLFPGAAQCLIHPDGALRVIQMRGGERHSPCYYAEYGGGMPLPDSVGNYLLVNLVAAPLTVGFLWVAGTIDTLFVEPFRGWSPEVDYYDPLYIEKRSGNGQSAFLYDCHASPKLQATLILTEDERRDIGLWTCFDRHVPQGGQPPGRVGFVGCYKYPLFYVGVDKTKPEPAGTETKTRFCAISGPFEATVEIPELGYREVRLVEATGDVASFSVPKVPQDCTVRAYASFREASSSGVAAGGRGDVMRQALARTLGQRFSFDIVLDGPQEAAVRTPSGERQFAVPPARQVATPQIAPKPLFRVIGIEPQEDGRYLVTIRVEDSSKTLNLIKAIRPEVQRIVREDFMGRNPSIPPQYVRDYLRSSVPREKNGEELVFSGWAFSVRPVEDGWSYDPDTRRGWVRILVAGGMPGDDAKRWARENIAAIVSEKNVALEAGKAPPSGAQYRSLAEKFEDGILTVEFEAIE